MEKQIPELLKDHILPFDWDVKSVWSLDSQIIEEKRSKLDYLLHLPLWSSVPNEGMLFDITPIEVITDPRRSPHQTERIEKTDESYPIDMLHFEGKLWILDGVHRLAKLFRSGSDVVRMRVHPDSVIQKIRSANKAVDTTAANARLFDDDTSKSTTSDVEAMTEAAVVSP